MDSFVNEVNHAWENADAIALATHALWRINHIHPFINGNGRTARALCYYVVCVKSGGLLKGSTILPELIRKNHSDYVRHLQTADAGFKAGRQDYVNDLHTFITRLVTEQLQFADQDSPL